MILRTRSKAWLKILLNHNLTIEEKTTDRGRVLFITDGTTLVGCALDFGIRVIHLSACGMENIFYEQPDDLSDGIATDTGWRVYGGHRIWNTPENDTNYYPDNDAVTYEKTDDGVIIYQNPDPLKQVKKSLTVSFLDDGRIKIINSVMNTSVHTVETAAWGVNTLKPGKVDVDFIPADVASDGYPSRNVSLWGTTNIADERIVWSEKHLTATHKQIENYFKIGMYTKSGKAVYERDDQKFTMEFETEGYGMYPDGGCNFELWLHKLCLEMESLSIIMKISTGESVTHTEYWKVEKI